MFVLFLKIISLCSGGPFKMVTIGCPETSVTECQSTAESEIYRVNCNCGMCGGELVEL
jgi:hypothetical protein